MEYMNSFMNSNSLPKDNNNLADLCSDCAFSETKKECGCCRLCENTSPRRSDAENIETKQKCDSFKENETCSTFWTNESNLPESDVFVISHEPYSMMLDADAKNNSKDNVVIYFPEIFYNHSQVKDLKYIDDLINEEPIHNPYQHEFTVYENLLSEQLSKSICDSYQKEYNNDYLIFSTSHSKLSSIQAKLKNCNFDACDEPSLSWDVSPIKNKYSLDSNLRHSTPRKIMDSCLSSEDSFDSEPEDDDIEESYLETVWMSRGNSSLNSCSLLIKNIKKPQESKLSQSMICKMEDVNESTFLRFQDVEDNFHVTLSSNEGESECNHSIDESFPLIGPPSISSFSDKTISSLKITYKDKLMEGLGVHATTNKLGFPMPQREIIVLPDIQESIMPHAPVSMRDHNFNMTMNELKKPVVVRSHKTFNSKVINGLWNEQKSKKNVLKRIHNSSDFSFRDRTEDSFKSNKFIKVQAKIEKIHKDFSHEVDCSPNPIPVSAKSKLFQTNISHLHPSNVTESKVVNEKPQAMKRKSRKLKKFCSLDLNESQENSGRKLCRSNKEWKSHDDLNGMQSPSLKADNYLLWPLVGLAVIAGFVAFCFRDKISFMIASKFPFERPPI